MKQRVIYHFQLFYIFYVTIDQNSKNILTISSTALV